MKILDLFRAFLFVSTHPNPEAVEKVVISEPPVYSALEALPSEDPRDLHIRRLKHYVTELEAHNKKAWENCQRLANQEVQSWKELRDLKDVLRRSLNEVREYLKLND